MSKIDILFLANFIILAPHLKGAGAIGMSASLILTMAYLTWWA